jgi:hypothetical protein
MSFLLAISSFFSKDFICASHDFNCEAKVLSSDAVSRGELRALEKYSLIESYSETSFFLFTKADFELRKLLDLEVAPRDLIF